MSATKCIFCGAAGASGAGFCRNCGQALPKSASSDRTQNMPSAGEPRQITIGRASGCTYAIDNPTISTQHALVEVLPGGGLRVRDLNSSNGTYLNSSMNRVGTEFVPLQPGDKLFLGRTEVPVSAILSRASPGAGGRPDQLETLGTKTLTGAAIIGRDPSAEVVVPHPTVSFRHARLHQSGGQYFIEDLKSTNGTFVNGVRAPADTRVPVKAGDEISFGGCTFVLNELGVLAPRAEENAVNVTADGLTIHIPDKSGGVRELLGDMSLTIEPGDLVALMGPSGAGKTTLLCALNGISRPNRGRVLYRNLDLAANFDMFRTMIGYVPQDDIVHAQLTVYEALYYTAKLRLPADTTDRQIDERIRKVLESVGLLDQIHEEIGDAVKKTLSGGQRKRVNLAMELLSDPMVLFLDEPTSGLSAVDAKSVVSLLKKLAEERRTIITTIHQPSLDVYSQFNLLAMISNHPPAKGAPRVSGRLVYFGPAMDAFEFFAKGAGGTEARQVLKPEDIEEDLKTRPVDEWVGRYDKSPLRQRYVGERSAKAGALASHRLPSPRKYRLRQLDVLCRRLARLKVRDRAQLVIALALPVVFGLLVTLSQRALSGVKHYGDFLDFGRRISTSHFLMVVAAVWFGCNNAIREIVGERAVYRRERLVNLSLASYFSSKYVVLGALGLLQCLLMLSIVYVGIDLKANFFLELFTLWVTCMVGTGIGLCISSMSRSTEQAIAALPLALLPMIVLGGSLTTVGDMRHRQPLGVIADLLAPTRWAYEANLLVENNALGSKARFDRASIPVATAKDLQSRTTASGNRPVSGTPPSELSSASQGSEDLAEKSFPEGKGGVSTDEPPRHSYAASLAWLGGMLIFWACATLMALKRDEWEWWQTLKSRVR